MRARLLFSAAFALLCLPLFLLQADAVQLEAQAVQALLAGLDLPEDGPLVVHWASPEADRAEEQSSALRAATRLDIAVPLTHDAVLGTFTIQRGNLDAEAVHVFVEGEQGIMRLTRHGEEIASSRMGSKLALIPPLLAILLAFLTRRTILSLGLGVLVGGVIAVKGTGGLSAFLTLIFGQILWHDILNDAFHLYILGFVILLSSTVAVITRMGGIDGMVNSLVRFAKGSRSVQAVAYFLGLGIFFDDYANTIVVGNSCGPLFDKQKISRAKLAYIVDSTAAPVAGVAVLSTWVAYQISTFAPQLPTVGMKESEGYALFLETIPYRFYCLLAIFLVGLVVWMQRDFGPMLKAERSARGSDGDAVDSSAIDDERMEAKPSVRALARNGLLPLCTMIFGTALLIYLFGASAVNIAADEGDTDSILARTEGGFLWLRQVLGASDSTKAIFVGSLSAFTLAALLAVGQRLLTVGETISTASKGVKVLFKDAVMVLILAWSIGAICVEVGTANYLVAMFQDLMSPQWLPIILFITACFVAFATGSSWTTMAILQPNVVLLAYQLGEQSSLGGHTLLVLSIGAVLEGAIFGDHCSPISDTTVLSSTASRCQHIEHVRTQAPYALMTAGVAITLAYVPVALWNVSPYICLGISVIALLGILRFFGRSPLNPAKA
ncbi:MAG: Na+/H+ antiporter NhaC family protein [Planctomycetota bacterium]|nr:Na+/H+ antiporter NhaC family protein [Planctomycetota bacterium]MDA1113010.1 Na+/H+ antiporter NhaC family protein [Planctomycetota bacterium]